MFESPRKPGSAWSESSEELHEREPVSPARAASHVGKKKKKRKKQQQEERSGSKSRGLDAAPLFCVEDTLIGTKYADEEVIVRGIFQIDKKSHDVVLTKTRVAWSPIEPETPTGQAGSAVKAGGVALSEVFAVKVKRRRSAGQHTGGTLLGITLFRCHRKGSKLKDQPVHLNNLSVDHCETWFRHLKELLAGFKSRPKSLLVFINPSSHKKEAQHIYQDHVAPLFHLADIKTHVTITEGKGNALSLLKESKLEEYDGVVCVGGDGTVAEVAYGLLLRSQMEAGRDTDSVFTPVRAALPLGVIPAGSTDIMACSVHGIRHPVTAAMHIIMGHHQPVDVCSFSSAGRLLRFGFSAMFGFGGRTLLLSEKHRWMPTAQRRELALIKALANLKPEDCELSYLPVKTSQTGALDQKNKMLIEDSEAEEEVEWKNIHGLYLNISIMAIPCLCSIAPYGLAPNTRLANGSMSLIAAGNTSRSEFVKHLKRYNSSSTHQFSFSFVQTHEVRAVRLRPHTPAGQWEEEESTEGEEPNSRTTSPIIQSDSSHPWNVDGDLLEVLGELLVRVHPQLLTMYGVEVEELLDTPVKCSCI